MICKETWVTIHQNILCPSERAATVPDDTKLVPLELWVKGHLQQDAHIGEVVTVITRTGRAVEGTLIEANPTYRHSFGEFIPELLKISDDVRKILI